MDTAIRMVRTCFTLAGKGYQCQDMSYADHEPATVMLNGPTFELAVKLTTLRPNAMAPLMARDIARRRSMCWTLYACTRSSSPEVKA